MNKILRNEFAASMLGVPGRFFNVIGEAGASTLASQTFGATRPAPDYGPKATVSVEVRFDDNCHNGHNSFAVTGEVRDGVHRGDRGMITCGAIHDDIAKYFPELAPLLKWHLTSSDGPMHYIANTLYHASDRDHNGLLKGEKRQIRNGRTGALCWTLEAVNAEGIGISDTPTGAEYRGADMVPLFVLKKECEGDAPPLATPRLRWVPWCRVGEGKARDFAAARSSAVWPEATDEQLSLPREELRKLLEDRHAALCAAFKDDMLRAGFLWDATSVTEPA